MCSVLKGQIYQLCASFLRGNFTGSNKDSKQVIHMADILWPETQQSNFNYYFHFVHYLRLVHIMTHSLVSHQCIVHVF